MQALSHLFEACRQGDLDTIQKTLSLEPELLNQQDMKGFSPLIIAVYNNQPAAVQLLLDNGADIAAQDMSGNTALMGAAFRGYQEVVQMLLDKGADVNQRNFQGAAALTFAATFGQMEIAKMLLDKGADLWVEDTRGKNPLDHAVMQENVAMVDLLEKYK